MYFQRTRIYKRLTDFFTAGSSDKLEHQHHLRRVRYDTGLDGAPAAGSGRRLDDSVCVGWDSAVLCVVGAQGSEILLGRCG